jgi:phage shock protein C
MNDRLYRSRDDRILAGVAAGLADHLNIDPTIVRVAWLILVPLTGGLALLAYIVMAIIVPEETDGLPAAPWTGWSPGWTPTGTGTTPSAPPGAGGPAAPPPGLAQPPVPPAPPIPAAGFGTGWTPPMTRADWRAQRRAYRAARRAQGGPGIGGAVIGIIFVLVGAWLLVRQYMPDFDPDRFWPFVLVALGVVLLVFAIARRPDVHVGPGGPDGPASPGGPTGPQGPAGPQGGG